MVETVKNESRRAEKEEKIPYEQLKETRNAKYKAYKERVEKAINEGKIFRIISTMNVSRIASALRHRGYIETIPHTWNNKYYRMSNRELLDKAAEGNMYETCLLSKLIDGFLPNYMWVVQPRLYEVHKNVQFMNKIYIEEAFDWGFKDGMCKCMSMIKEKSGEDVVNKYYSRSYTLVGCEEINEFNRDYRLTVAISLIKFILAQKDPKDVFAADYGKVRPNVINFALSVIYEEINAKKSNGSVTYLDGSDYNELRWEQLKKSHIALLKRKEKINEKQEQVIENYIFRAKVALEEVFNVWPYRKTDGYHNVWLCKPTYMGEGYGIVITDNDQMVLDVVNLKKHNKYIIQKYVERPMLIYGHKFDIRQYFIVQIDEDFVRVWSHPLCSIKFASQEYTLRNFHESIHVTNTAVQLKYKNRSGEKRLPDDHLWTLYDFMSYLNSINERYLWKGTMYRQMKEFIVEVVKGTLSEIEMRPGRFELFGIDWLIAEDYTPILLEINRPPSLEYYSPVSGIVCGTIMEDLIKVTVDFVRNSDASTGDFELIYKTENPNSDMY
ncbi:tubulin glycylase 3B-like [Culicoides brevitarsis]|uniref:tubulin glycylase 3B-like n=1 Tax=Culicoides brevitarsis TaxID=469753 RepID=UPI00307BE473